MSEPRIVGHTELCLFLLPFLQQGNFTVEALVSALLEDFQVIDGRASTPAPAPPRTGAGEMKFWCHNCGYKRTCPTCQSSPPKATYPEK